VRGKSDPKKYSRDMKEVKTSKDLKETQDLLNPPKEPTKPLHNLDLQKELKVKQNKKNFANYSSNVIRNDDIKELQLTPLPVKDSSVLE